MIGFVYFASAEGEIKIGYSANPRGRELSLRAKLIGVVRGERKEERRLHNKFRAFCNGGEWFQDVPEIRAYIKEKHGKENMRLLHRLGMAKAILIKPKEALWKQIKEVSKSERRKLAPTVLLLLERYFELATRPK